MPIPTKEQIKQAYDSESFEKIKRRTEDYIGDMMITNAKAKNKYFEYCYNIMGPLAGYSLLFNKEVITAIITILESKGYVVHKDIRSGNRYCYIRIMFE